MRDLVILGAGGASREIAGAVEDINRRERVWNLLGFLDDDPAKIGRTINGVRVLGEISSAPRYSAHFVIGIAAVRNRWIRRRVVESLGFARDRFATLIHPSATVSRFVKIGFGSAILHNAVITPDAQIGDHVIVEYGAMIGHDAVVEDFATIGPGTIVSGSVHLRQGVFLGAGSMIRDNLTVSEGALVGMGAVVVKDVAAQAIVVGNPARRLESA
jgi:sugar O-acyltransferase (sialic acid O-acetyltransferase NeuD family)